MTMMRIASCGHPRRKLFICRGLLRQIRCSSRPVAFFLLRSSSPERAVLLGSVKPCALDSCSKPFPFHKIQTHLECRRAPPTDWHGVCLNKSVSDREVERHYGRGGL